MTKKDSCSVCKSTNKRLINHHLSYKDDWVILVCDKCHSMIHHNKKHKYYPIDRRPDSYPKHFLKEVEEIKA